MHTALTSSAQIHIPAANPSGESHSELRKIHIIFISGETRELAISGQLHNPMETS
jgi:hypothetical protein